MVYINETTFVMWDFPDIFEEMTGWFPVDEVIAPAVRELNLRGYRTTYSCSGHPVSGLRHVDPPWCDNKGGGSIYFSYAFNAACPSFTFLI